MANTQSGKALIRVLLIEQNKLCRSALSRAISKEEDIEVTELTQVTEAIQEAESVKKMNVCVISVDQKSHNSNLSTVRKLNKAVPGCGLLAIADLTLASSISEALGVYVQGFVSRNIDLESMVVYIRRVAKGEVVIEPTLAIAAVCADKCPLTESELAFLRGVASGKRNKEIAAELHIAEGTARNKMAKIVRKSGANTPVQAVQIAKEAGWL